MPLDGLPDSLVSRVATLVQEGALPRACAALSQDPPVHGRRSFRASPSPPWSLIEDRVNMNSLRRIATRAAPTVEVDQVREALHSFPSTSAGRSSLRPSPIRDAFSRVNSRAGPHERLWGINHGPSPNASLRPVAVGETFRRLTSKVAVDLITDRAHGVLEPLQLGVKTPNGCEATIHVTR